MGHLFSFKPLASNMRSPSAGILGHLASAIMQNANELTSIDCARRLGIAPRDVVLEIGPGSGFALKEISSFLPARLVAVEISEKFRRDLTMLQLPIPIEIHGAFLSWESTPFSHDPL